ncbi:T9SS type A sorting domain-containing protein [uncultured Kordia sp.]|uniref:DUF7619 domain-containing protein n=1 Tax=uncultured Kordia sp. TaxID=507699 RepID=UPI002604B35E|nr:T9SS type A sorting domain-containing protein [uncultured Kordia sp.]
MKKSYLLLPLFFIIQWSQAQIINIPDANFKNYLLTTNLVDTDDDEINDSTIDLNNDGEIQESEALLVTFMSATGRSISSLEGIEYFTNLEALYCSANPISTLSLTQNVNLKTLACSNDFSNFSLTAVDVTQNVNLESLFLSGNDQLTTLDVTQNINLEYLHIYRCNFTSIDVTQNTQLKNFSCFRNGITSLDVTSNPNLEDLRCNNNLLTSLDISQNPNLQLLTASDNSITTINPTQNPSLRTLSIDKNSISTIDVTQNPHLQSLRCSETSLTSLNLTQNPNLKYLDCEKNSFTSLDVSQNPILQTVNCFENQLTSLDFTQNPNLENVNCNDNLLTSINTTGATSLKRLFCNNNLLETIDVTSNNNLIYFECNDNSLTQLELSGNPNLLGLECNSNSLTALDLSQNPEMIGLQCTDNLLTELDVSQNPRLNDIDCYNNQLTYINVKNGIIISSIYDLRFDNNPTLEFICVDEEEQAFISALSIVPATAVVSTYCSFTPGGEYVVLQGSSKLDNNTNGCDINDIVYPSIGLAIVEGSATETIITDTSGDYALYLSEGETYTITPQLENSAYYTVSPASIMIDTATASNPTIQDFCVTPNGTHNDVEVTIMPLEIARPGFDASYQIQYENKGNTTLSGTVQLTFDDDLMDVVTATPMSDTQAINTSTWNFTNLVPFETRNIAFTMNINSPTEVPAVNGGDVLSFETTINSGVSDETPNNNIMVLQQTVVNSYDPNDIRCLEGETVTTDYINEFVHYMIRFENTGTASAVNVVVTDEIDTSKFDISTLRPVSSSHEMVTNIKSNNEVEFIFENINLPFDDADNDGYLVFKIKTLTTLVENDTFDNTANIYFDFNFPIITNTASTLIANPLSIAEENLERDMINIYPNPTNGILNITAKEAIKAIEIRTMEGRLLKSNITQITHNSYEVNLSEAAAGIYILNTLTNSGKIISKVMKE